MMPKIGMLSNGSSNLMVWTYLVYLLLSVTLTIWVAKTLHKNGRIFLVESFLGNVPLADSVNHLLVVGFYLINIGYVTLALKYGPKAADPQTALEMLSTKVGLVLVVLVSCTFSIFSFFPNYVIVLRSAGHLLFQAWSFQSPFIFDRQKWHALHENDLLTRMA